LDPPDTPRFTNRIPSGVIKGGRKILYQWRSIVESLNIGQTDAIKGGFSIATFEYWRITKWSPTVHPAVPEKTASKACWVAGIYKTIVTAEANI
jgi:hypothetical protein